MPFKKGDKVVVVRSSASAGGYLKAGLEFVVHQFDPNRYVAIGGAVYLEGHTEHGWKQDRFALAKPEELVFAVGAQVERTGERTLLLEQGQKYTIETVYRDELGGVNKIKLQGINASYHVRGFKVVKNAVPFDVDKWNPAVGEKVFVVAQDAMHSEELMDHFINDGVEYVIDSMDGRYITLNNTFTYYKTSLRPVNVGQAVKPVKPEPKELREALFARQKAKGLGSDLCSYAFETKDGKQHLYPYVCHAMLRNDHGEIVKVAYGFRHDMARVNAPNTLEAHKAYSKYVISESPWASAFITQDIEEAITHDILMNVEVNRYMMAGGCVALRTGQEYPDRPGIFKEMLDRGHNPHTCWLMSCAFSRVREGQYNFNSWTGGHDVIDKYRDFEQVIQFFQTGYHIEKCSGTYGGVCHPLTTEPFRTHHGAYAIANTIAESSDRNMPKSIGAWFEKNTVKSTVGEGWDKKTVMDVKALDDVATKLDKLIKGVA